MDSKNVKWGIIKIEVEQANQIVPIDFKLANNIKYCNGIYISVKELLDTEENYISQIGELSLSFNTKQIHPLHFTAEYNKDLSDKKESLKLDSEMKANKNITGFYIDYSTSLNNKGDFLPYSLSIYLGVFNTRSYKTYKKLIRCKAYTSILKNE